MNPESRYNPLIQQLVGRLEKLAGRLRVLESTRQLFDVANEVEPDAFTSSPVDDLDPQDADVLRLTMNQATTLNGIADGRMGRFLELYNASIYTLTLADEAATTLASNRFSTPASASIAVASRERIRLYYDSTSERWTTG